MRAERLAQRGDALVEREVALEAAVRLRLRASSWREDQPSSKYARRTRARSSGVPARRSVRMSRAPSIADFASGTPFSSLRKVKAHSSSVWPCWGVSRPWPQSQIQSASGSSPASRAASARFFFCWRYGW